MFIFFNSSFVLTCNIGALRANCDRPRPDHAKRLIGERGGWIHIQASANHALKRARFKARRMEGRDTAIEIPTMKIRN
jgi:hypothetical protein